MAQIKTSYAPFTRSEVSPPLVLLSYVKESHTTFAVFFYHVRHYAGQRIRFVMPFTSLI